MISTDTYIPDFWSQILRRTQYNDEHNKQKKQDSNVL